VPEGLMNGAFMLGLEVLQSDLCAKTLSSAML
jgi:hypothetical protein